MGKRKKQYDDDDGRTIVNMNVEGMPWYRPERPAAPDASGQSEDEQKIELNSEEGRAAMHGALAAALLVVGIFAVVFFLFILFCDVIWLK